MNVNAFYPDVCDVYSNNPPDPTVRIGGLAISMQGDFACASRSQHGTAKPWTHVALIAPNVIVFDGYVGATNPWEYAFADTLKFLAVTPTGNGQDTYFVLVFQETIGDGNGGMVKRLYLDRQAQVNPEP